MKKILPLAVLYSLAAANQVSLAGTGLLAYEGFNYAAGISITTANGGAGWSNSWVDVSGTAGESVVAGSLLAGEAMPFGFDARSSGNGSRCGRSLAATATPYSIHSPSPN